MLGLQDITIQKIDHAYTGRLVRNARAQKGLTLEQVAGKMKMKISYLSDMERGKRNWTSERLEQVKKILK